MDPMVPEESGAGRPEETARATLLGTRLHAIRDALRGARQGDFSVRLQVSPEEGGLLADIALDLNALLELDQALLGELDRVTRAVTSRGDVWDRASIGPVGGGWRAAIGSINELVASIARVLGNTTEALARVERGDLSVPRRIAHDGVPPRGAFLRLQRTLDTTVGRLGKVSGAISQVLREVGEEGKLGGTADARGLLGVWKQLVTDANRLSTGIAAELRSIAGVSEAIARGDLARKITVEAHGEIGELKDSINVTVDQLRSFAAQVMRVAHEVGTEGKLGAQAEVPDALGVWRDLTDAVNGLAGNLTDQVRNISQVASAIAQGDLSQKITVEARGELLDLKNTLNATVDRLQIFASEVTRVAREVGREGRLGGQAEVEDVLGAWKDLTDGVNMLAGRLTSQVRDIARVATAIANGDLTQKITVQAEGEILELKTTVNAMLDRLRTFAAEVTRVAREVGTEGRLGGQAEVPGVGGTWHELTACVNLMARNLTDQVRGIARVVTAVASGDLDQTLVLEARGEIAQLAGTINAMTSTLRTFTEQVTALTHEVGLEGKLGGEARVPGVSGSWRDLTDGVNLLAGNLTSQVRSIAQVTVAVARGDLSQKISVAAKGEFLELKDTVNAMVDQLRTFAAEVTRVAREVGTEGRLGGQASVPDVSGTWKDLTDSVNVMASNLTDQVRGIGQLVGAVAQGDLTKRLVLVAHGEVAELADTFNAMIDTLRTFAAEVSNVAREVGIEGRLGGQAYVPSASGTWRDLTDNVNWLAANLTNQVRAISEVAKAVTEGDLTRSITVEAQGEVLSLKDTINQMIANLRDTVVKSQDQDWLKSNLAHFFALMQGQRDLQSLADSLLRELAPTLGVQSAAFYLAEDGELPSLRLTSTWAHVRRHELANRFGPGEGLVGQCALERKTIVVSDLPEGFIPIASGLGIAPPRNVALLPILFEGRVRGVLELASFHDFTHVQLTFLEQLLLNVGQAINLIGTRMRTEELLQQLRGSNLELEHRRTELEEKARQLEDQNRELAEAAKLEAKAEELAKVSQYKTQFLTNMSHEIRTPLNSMMILARMLESDEGQRLSQQQREWAGTIVSSGRDLLSLLNQILDLSKVEAGRVEPQLRTVDLRGVCEFVEQTFRPVATQKGLSFAVELGGTVPRAVVTDEQLLEQILKNLIANALKFTERGSVSMRVERVSSSGGRGELAFVVSDSGPGIAPDKQAQIFEPFQQADASITRKFGGTGLGLALSRQYAKLLGGALRLESQIGKGSVFTLHLPVSLDPASARASEPARETNISEAAHLSGHKLLIVEDDPRNLYATTAYFERAKVKVLAANTAQQAYQQLAEHPDVVAIVMDIMLPEVDGLEATREIRKNPRFAQLPIIAYSAKASAADRADCLRAGCSDFVSKPADPDDLLEAIVRQLE